MAICDKSVERCDNIARLEEGRCVLKYLHSQTRVNGSEKTMMRGDTTCAQTLTRNGAKDPENDATGGLGGHSRKRQENYPRDM